MFCFVTGEHISTVEQLTVDTLASAEAPHPGDRVTVRIREPNVSVKSWVGVASDVILGERGEPNAFVCEQKPMSIYSKCLKT